MSTDVTNSSSMATPESALAGPQPVPAPAPAPAPSVATPSHPGATPSTAADTDRIEQEWVTKTKQVLLATRNDPYEQNRQLALLKADYMLKRYNKQIKLGE